MNKKVLLVAAILVGMAVVAAVLLVAKSSGGGNGENGTVIPSPTSVVSPTVAPNTPTTAPSPTPNVSPSLVGTPIPVATITIRALENPYRFEPEDITLASGETYTIEVVNDADTPHWLVEPDYLHLDVYVLPHTKKTVTLKADNAWYSRFVFYCKIHRNFSMNGTIVIDAP